MERKISYANRALCALFGLGEGELVGWTHLSLAHRLAAWSETPDDLLRRLEIHPEGPFVLREELELDTPVKRVLRYVAKPVRLPHGIAQLGTFTDVTAEVSYRKANHAPVMFVEDEWPKPSR
jgi:PAS domain-containing protein